MDGQSVSIKISDALHETYVLYTALIQHKMVQLFNSMLRNLGRQADLREHL